MMFNSSLLGFLGIDEDELKGNGIVDGKINVADAVASGAASPEKATLLNGLGLLEQVMDMEAPEDPGKNFNSYLADQGGLKGFMGGVVGEPILNSLFFGKDEDEYEKLKAGYAMDKKRYDSLWDVAVSGASQEAKNNAPDSQNTAVSDYIRSVAAGEVELDPLVLTALVGEAGGYSAANVNPVKLGQGQTLLGIDGKPIHSVAPPNDKAKSVQEYEHWLTLNPDATIEDKQNAYENIVRAGFTANGVRFNSFTGDPIGGDVDGRYAATQEDATTTAREGATHSFDSFEREQGRYIAAWDEHEKFNDRIQRFDTALELFDPNRPGGAIDTGPVAGIIFNTFGMGDEGVATVANLGVRETIDMLSNFKGTTTDFEFTKSELGAFASILKGEEVNKETLQVARDALVKQQKRNDMAAEAAYKSMGDYVGENTTLRNSYDTTGSNYQPWFEMSGADDSGMIDGVPTFERFSKDANDRGMTDPAEIRRLYNENFGIPRK